MTLIGDTFLLFQRVICILLGVFGIGFLIGFHELGHFLFCKLFGVRTPSFSIGFGPKIWSRKIGGTEFVISPIPLGGFVEIAGAAEVGQGEQKEAQSTDSSSFATKPYYQKLLIMLGGIICNLLFAYAIFILLSMVGMPKTPLLYPLNDSTQIQRIKPESAASKVNIREGDRIIKVNDIIVQDNTRLLLETLQPLANNTVSLELERDGAPVTTQVTLDSTEIGDKTVGSLGIIEWNLKPIAPLSLGKAFAQGISITNQWIYRTVMAFVSIFKKGDVQNLGGPLSVVSVTMQAACTGLDILLLLLALISINLAILNLIPLPILDGGQILFYTIEAIIGRPLPLKIREYIHMGSWILILALIILLSIRDIGRIAQPALAALKGLLG